MSYELKIVKTQQFFTHLLFFESCCNWKSKIFPSICDFLLQFRLLIMEKMLYMLQECVFCTENAV